MAGGGGKREWRQLSIDRHPEASTHLLIKLCSDPRFRRIQAGRPLVGVALHLATEQRKGWLAGCLYSD